MALSKTFIPYGGYWTTPFCRWQGSLAEQHSMKLAAESGRRFFAQRKLDPEQLEGLVLGITVPQPHSFYGAPWLAGLLGAPGITGPTVSQACATSARMVATAAMEIEAGQHGCLLAVGCDRTSNGPHVYYPSPAAPGGTGQAENPVLDNFSRDPYAGKAMIETAEMVANAEKISRREQDDATLLRYQQYERALADDRAFQRRYMLEVELRRGKKVLGAVPADEGVHPTTAEGLANLRPVTPGGTVTYGSQTHPADGNAGMLLCSRERAAALSTDSAVTIQVLAVGSARVGAGLMPASVVPAARRALELGGVEIADCARATTHNPFAINDVYFCRELGFDPEHLNVCGSPLVYGHPQAPTGLRAMIELIEALHDHGGGIGVFSGCAAGDSAMAVVLKVS